MSRTLCLAVAVFSFAVVLAGCGSDDTSTTTSSGSGNSTTSTAPKEGKPKDVTPKPFNVSGLLNGDAKGIELLIDHG